jgi:hypothetical protein
VSKGVCAAGDDGRERRLTGGAGQRRRPVDRAGSGVPGRGVGGQLTGGVDVDVDGQVEPAAQRRDEAAAAEAEQPAMSLIASTWAPASTICSASR